MRRLKPKRCRCFDRPPLRPEALGDPAFLAAHGLRYAYLGGALANAISSEAMVEALAARGCGRIWFGCLTPERVERPSTACRPISAICLRDEPHPQPGRSPRSKQHRGCICTGHRSGQRFGLPAIDVPAGAFSARRVSGATAMGRSSRPIVVIAKVRASRSRGSS
jgi:hypothetical protein